MQRPSGSCGARALRERCGGSAYLRHTQHRTCALYVHYRCGMAILTRLASVIVASARTNASGTVVHCRSPSSIACEYQHGSADAAQNFKVVPKEETCAPSPGPCSYSVIQQARHLGRESAPLDLYGTSISCPIMLAARRDPADTSFCFSAGPNKGK